MLTPELTVFTPTPTPIPTKPPPAAQLVKLLLIKLFAWIYTLSKELFLPILVLEIVALVVLFILETPIEVPTAPPKPIANAPEPASVLILLLLLAKTLKSAEPSIAPTLSTILFAKLALVLLSSFT